jgi:integrase/recombinase XerD
MVNYEIKMLAKLVGIEKRVHFHMSRSSFATNLLREGERIEVVSKLLGHSKLATTMMHYAKVVDDVKQQAVAKLPYIKVV